MGIESREYLRGDNGPRSFGGGGGWQGYNIVKGLIIANVVVFVLQLLWSQPLVLELAGEQIPVPGQRMSVVQSWLDLNVDKVVSGFQVWRLVTYAFCHDRDAVFHILMNMLILYWTGRRIQTDYGPREFLLFYLTAAVLSGMGFLLLQVVLGQPGIAIGASGAVAAVFIAYAMKYPDEVWRLMGIVPVQVKWLCIFFIIFDLHPVLLELGGSNAGTGVAHAAHLGGYLFGFLYERNHWQLGGLLDRVRRSKLRLPRRSSHLKVYEPQDNVGNLESRVDELLKKVHEQGEASLTDAERAQLAEASRRYRSRM